MKRAKHTYKDRAALTGCLTVPEGCRELTDEEASRINGGGKSVENSNEGVANAQPGDTVTRSDKTTVTLTQADIDYAKGQLDTSSGVSSATTNPTTTTPGSTAQNGAGSPSSSSNSNATPTNAQDNRPTSSYGNRTSQSPLCNTMKKQAANDLPWKHWMTGTVVMGDYLVQREFSRNGLMMQTIVGQKASSESNSYQKVENDNKLYKQRELEVKYGYPYSAPEYGSLCLATSIINLYVKKYSITPDAVDKVMSEAKGKYISTDGTVLNMTEFSKRLAKECNSDRYFDYVYYNPETKQYASSPKELTKSEFLGSEYEYAIGGFYHEGGSAPSTFSSVAHYEMVQNFPYVENNPGVGQYELYKLRPVNSYKR